jgi:5-methylthioadenosine/S-adenosylhomocysteine deaminase
MRLAALLAKGVSGDPTALPARQALTMATRTGARALHLGDVTGSIEAGKRADLIVVDLDQAHNVPRFARDADSVYAQLVYSSKAADVVDVMCDGRWLMRERRLLTLDEDALRLAAADMARRVDAFLIQREQSVLKKLVAIGGATEEESFEVQVKARLASAESVLEALAGDDIRILRAVHYHQYDTYFFFDDPRQGRLRYREDESLDEGNAVTKVRARLTLTGLTHEAAFGSVLLFRSRFLAPATHSPRFYREYFKPRRERDIEKIRRRWLVEFRGVQFYVHLDRLLNPASGGYFLEVKSRTWSRRDAEEKAEIIGDLLERLGARKEQTVQADYVEF